ncbi:MAG: tetratricopeptide repeat protein, partial [Bryobacteraceae bacterium]|nr:tetratricopeptide repeat protein [Bryobacteraceae bacterium]
VSAMAAEGPLGLARDYYDRTLYTESLKILLPLKEKDARINELIGRNYFMQNDFKKATEYFEKCVAAEPNNSQYFHWLGRTYGRRAETSSVFTAPQYASKARQNFERAVQLNPKNSDALNDLFEYYLQAPGFLGGGMDKAAALVEKIAALDPAEQYYAKARIAEEKKEFQTAEMALRRAAELAPMQIGRLIDLGKFLAQRGKIQESEAAFARAEKIDAKSPKLLIERAETYINTGQNLPAAKRLLEMYLKADLSPEDRPKEEARRLLAKIKGA